MVATKVVGAGSILFPLKISCIFDQAGQHDISPLAVRVKIALPVFIFSECQRLKGKGNFLYYFVQAVSKAFPGFPALNQAAQRIARAPGF